MTPAAQAAHDEGETVSGLALVVSVANQARDPQAPSHLF